MDRKFCIIDPIANLFTGYFHTAVFFSESIKLSEINNLFTFGLLNSKKI